MMRIFSVFLLLLSCGCLATGHARIEQNPATGITTTDIDYFRLGDQQISDFTVSSNVDGTKSLHLGNQKSDGTMMGEILNKMLDYLAGMK